MKSGFVSLIGRPNVGKSTLLNALIGTKIAITSNKPQTTRNNIQGVYHDKDLQIIFIDTPGIHKPQNKLGKSLNSRAYYSIDDVDVILFLVDVTKPLGTGDKFVIEKIEQQSKPVILILNKVDLIKKEKLLPIIDQYQKLYPFDEIVPLSALKNDNVKALLNVIKKYLTDTEKYYEDDEITNASKEFMVGELVREKILQLTNDEIPHTITCVVEKIEEKKDIININVMIVIERENIKKIIIGKQGSMLKEIGSRARFDIEAYLGKKVYLELYVKTINNWRDKESYLVELGLKNE
ncbi:MAG: GTPase Era [Bacilli bacterium]|nr:GTPase Era [Bacilli bacterium]